MDKLQNVYSELEMEVLQNVYSSEVELEGLPNVYSSELERLLEELLICSRVLPHKFTPFTILNALGAFSSLKQELVGLSKEAANEVEYVAIACLNRTFEHYKSYALEDHPKHEHNFIGM